MIRYHARWVLPVGGELLRDATVVVDGNRIVWVGARANAPRGGDDTDLGDAVLLPGLVNAHVHLDLAAFAGAIATREFFPWLRSLVRLKADVADAPLLADAARWCVADQLAHGVTTMAHTGPDALALDALDELGARGTVYLEAFDPNPAGALPALEELRARVDRARARASARVRVGVSPHAPYSVSDALYGAIAGYALQESLPVAVHIAESADEYALVSSGNGEFADFVRARGIEVGTRARSPVALLERTGVLDTAPLCIHAVRIDAEDIAAMAAAGATVAHCPGANAWFAYGTSPVADLVRAGVPVGLGTDSAASNTAVRILREAKLAAIPATAAERIALATQGGARALGLADAVGTLRPGMRADLAAFAVHSPVECDPDPAAYLLAHCTDAPSALTVVDGVVRARHGRVPGLDEALVQRMEGHVARTRQAGVALADVTGRSLDSGL